MTSLLPSADCRGCGKPIIWVKLKSGFRMPVDYQAQAGPRFGLVAVNHKTGGGKVLNNDDCGNVPSTREASRSAPVRAWQREAPLSFHRTHFADRECPIVKARIRGDQ